MSRWLANGVLANYTSELVLGRQGMLSSCVASSAHLQGELRGPSRNPTNLVTTDALQAYWTLVVHQADA